MECFLMISFLSTSNNIDIVCFIRQTNISQIHSMQDRLLSIIIRLQTLFSDQLSVFSSVAIITDIHTDCITSPEGRPGM